MKGKRDGKGRIPRGGEPELSSQIIALARVQAPPQGVIRAGKEAVTALAVAISLSPSSQIRSAPAGGGQDPVTTSVKPSPPARDGLPPSCARRVCPALRRSRHRRRLTGFNHVAVLSITPRARTQSKSRPRSGNSPTGISVT